MNFITLLKKIIPIAFSGCGVTLIGFLFKTLSKKTNDEAKSVKDNHSKNTFRDINGNSNIVFNNGGDVIYRDTNEDIGMLEDKYQDACSYVKVDREKALKKFEKLLDSLSGNSSPKLFYLVNSKIGMIYGMKAFDKDKRHNCEMAIKFYVDAFEKKKGIEYEIICNDYHNLGNIYCMLGETYNKEENTLKAIECYKQSLEICNQINNKCAYGETLGSIGLAYRSLSIVKDKGKNLQYAIDYFKQGEKYCNKGEKYANLKHNQAITYVDLFKMYHNKVYLTKAKNAFECALAVFSIETAPINYAVLKGNMANFYIYMYEYSKDKSYIDKAIQCCEDALLVQTKASYPQGYALCNRNLGNCFFELFRVNSLKEYFEKSLEAYEEALNIYNVINEPLHYAYVQKSIGDLYSVLADIEEKEKNLQKSICFYDKSLNIITLEKYPEDNIEVKKAKQIVQMKLVDEKNKGQCL